MKKVPPRAPPQKLLTEIRQTYCEKSFLKGGTEELFQKKCSKTLTNASALLSCEPDTIQKKEIGQSFLKGVRGKLFFKKVFPEKPIVQRTAIAVLRKTDKKSDRIA
ncbi:MAG: hypothetical protein E7604_05655 [Ruminococcaceae bacterium]|nr:hypothetical protein [Oscillospiraceae bacterium]